MDLAVASRVAGIVSTPSDFLLLLLLVGVVLQWTRRYQGWGKAIISGTVVLLLLLLLLPLGDWLIAPLESRFKRPPLPSHVDGIVVLGGGENVDGYAVHGLESYIPAEGQLKAAAELARRYPDAKLIFSGGNQPLTGAHISEATVARAVLEQLAVPASRLTLESRSRDTWENLINSKKLAHPKPGETWP